MKITIKQTGYYDVSWFGTEGSGSRTQFLEEGEEVEVDAERAAAARIGGASLTVKWSEQQLPHDAGGSFTLDEVLQILRNLGLEPVKAVDMQAPHSVSNASEHTCDALREWVDSVCYAVGRCVATNWHDESPQNSLLILRASAIKRGYGKASATWQQLPLPDGLKDSV